MNELPQGIVIVALTQGGLDVSGRIKAALPDAAVHGLKGRTEGADTQFDDTVAHLRHLFTEGRPIVGVCAAGIVIRALAPLLADKGSEPPVLSVSEDGAHVVPLVGGHHGANDLAAVIAEATGGTAAITTAGDVAFGLALDDPPSGWRVANPGAAKRVTAALLAGESVRLDIEAGDPAWLTESGAPFGESGDVCLRVTDRADAGPDGDLILHPPVLALGVGCERGVEADELITISEQMLADEGWAPGAMACVVSVDLKADEACVHAVARHFGVPVRFFPVDTLEAETPRLANPSDVVFHEIGCHGVAEGAALAAVGAEGALVAEKRVGKRTTCALARSPGNLDPSDIGSQQGRLSVVGIGPGPDGWRTPAVSRALAGATDIVGYALYLDLIAEAVAGKTLHDSALSEEEARVRLALDLAAEGRDVALVCSGDAGIYALATLVFELLDREDRGDWNRLAISVEPGVSAVQAAAARLGAPIGHDFCTISLSDLLTPWPEIRRRLEAAAQGDFVVALYNPVSKRRRTQLVEARDILMAARGSGTPVALARNLGRDGETVEVIRLDELTPDRADMLTLVLIGNSQSRLTERGVNRWLYTPRGYGSKMDQAANS